MAVILGRRKREYAARKMSADEMDEREKRRRERRQP